MTPDQIEAERVRFEASKEWKYEGVSFRRYYHGGYECNWMQGRWQGWLARAEEQYAERKGE